MKPPCILIVDDDPNVRHLLRRFLATSGCEVRESPNAEDAIARVDTEPPAVAFCDVHMPGANGLWLADQIRRASPSTALVLATGDADVPAAESLRTGVVAYLLKPLDKSHVLNALEEGLRWSSAASLETSRSVRNLTPGARGLLNSPRNSAAPRWP